MKGQSKVMSLRLPWPLANEVAVVARVDEVAIAAVIREALQNHVTARGSDPDFQRRLEERLGEDREVLERFRRSGAQP